MEENQIIDKSKQLKKDIEYIKEDIIAYQNNGLICKVCKPLKCITVTNLSRERYIKFWQDKYKLKDDIASGRLDQITKACEEKLENGMSSLEEIIEIQKNSKDPKEETKKLIKEITDTTSKSSNMMDLDEDEEDDEE